MEVINVRELHKSYKDNKVLKGISFKISKGEIFAVLGTNGAGKTTLLECMEGIKTFDAGEIDISTIDELENKKMSLGVQLQSSSLPELLKVKEAIMLFCVWNKVKYKDQLVSSFGLGELLEKKYRELSTGQKRKLHLVLALINDPDIIFLDEPTAGLDVQSRASLHVKIRELKKQGKTIIIASHDMAEVESLCDRLIMIQNGLIVFEGTVDEFTKLKKDKFKINFKISEESEYTTIETFDIHQGLQEVINSNETIYDLKVDHSTLEDVFLMISEVGENNDL
jgi:ABC-2 type transport system ATP-binding protein